MGEGAVRGNGSEGARRGAGSERWSGAGRTASKRRRIAHFLADPRSGRGGARGSQTGLGSGWWTGLREVDWAPGLGSVFFFSFYFLFLLIKLIHFN